MLWLDGNDRGGRVESVGEFASAESYCSVAMAVDKEGLKPIESELAGTFA
jgi:hypothetical protein